MSSKKHMEFNISIPLMKSLENALVVNGRQYIKEIAGILKVDEKALAKRVLPSADTIRLHIHNLQDTLQCEAYTTKESIVVRCRRPVFTGSSFCCNHSIRRTTIIESPSIVYIQKIVDAHDRCSLWVKNDTEIINSENKNVGLWNPNKNKLTMYTIV